MIIKTRTRLINFDNVVSIEMFPSAALGESYLQFSFQSGGFEVFFRTPANLREAFDDILTYHNSGKKYLSLLNDEVDDED